MSDTVPVDPKLVVDARVEKVYEPQVGDAIIDTLNPSYPPVIIRHVGGTCSDWWNRRNPVTQESYYIFVDGDGEPVQIPGTANSWVPVPWARKEFPPRGIPNKYDQYRVLRNGYVVYESPTP